MKRRVTGEGLPLPKSPDRRGDLIVEYEVKFPERLSQSAKDTIANVLPASWAVYTTKLEPLPLGIFGFIVFKGWIFELTPIMSPRGAGIVELLLCNVLPMRVYLNQNIAGLDWLFVCVMYILNPCFLWVKTSRKSPSATSWPAFCCELHISKFTYSKDGQ